MKKIDTKLIEDSIKNILIALGDNPDREGLKETPKRVARMYEEVFRGMTYSNDEIAKMYGKCFEDIETNDLVIVKDIPVFSYCEHHMALMYNAKIHVAYIPKNKVIGLSKIARIADMVCRRLQLQERICTDIADILEKAIGVENIMVIMEGEHSCMTARGIAKPGVSTKVSALRGMFKTSESLRKETYDLLRT